MAPRRIEWWVVAGCLVPGGFELWTLNIDLRIPPVPVPSSHPESQTQMHSKNSLLIFSFPRARHMTHPFFRKSMPSIYGPTYQLIWRRIHSLFSKTVLIWGTGDGWPAQSRPKPKWQVVIYVEPISMLWQGTKDAWNQGRGKGIYSHVGSSEGGCKWQVAD